MLEAHYNGKINISDYWHVGDTRIMHLNAMSKTTGASESHVAQDMTMVIIGIEHDNLKTPINGKTKAAITLQCREVLGNNGVIEFGGIAGAQNQSTPNYQQNPRRTWLNETFVNSLPNIIKSLIKTIIKKNIANHNSNPGAGHDTEDKAFLTSYPEMVGAVSYEYYKGSVELEGNQYDYYKTTSNRIKRINNNGIGGNSTEYWLRSPGAGYSDYHLCIVKSGSVEFTTSNSMLSLAPAFCL